MNSKEKRLFDIIIAIFFVAIIVSAVMLIYKTNRLDRETIEIQQAIENGNGIGQYKLCDIKAGECIQKYFIIED